VETGSLAEVTEFRRPNMPGAAGAGWATSWLGVIPDAL
jgi:hypothetical protein